MANGSTSTRKRDHASLRRSGAEPVAVALGAVVVLTAGLITIALGMVPARPHSAASATGGPHPVLTAQTRQPPPAVSVLASAAPDELTAEFARRLFAFAPLVVVAAPGGATLPAAETLARRAHAPLLLTAAAPRAGGPRGATAGGRNSVLVSASLLAGIKYLRPRVVLTPGLRAGGLAARLPGVRVLSGTGAFPATGEPEPVHATAVLFNQADPGPVAAAMTTTAQVASATVIRMRGSDPRADPAAISALAALRPRSVLAVGSGFAPAATLASRLAVAATGRQLPGGGQVMFPGHRLVALYGHPGAPSLGALGEQGLAASISRAKRLAAAYRRLSDVPVIPAFEIIATVAEASAGPDGMYSSESTVSSLRPWVREATAAGMYVILDLQPGRASLLSQAEHYASLLALPDVGLALDAEWKLDPGQLPLRQIGSVSAGEVNSVIDWLARLTAAKHLPQKVLVLHQFRLSMIAGERDLDTSHDDLSIVIHMDGQGTPQTKQSTWQAVTSAAPPGVVFGWKNFITKDHPMLTPRETMAKQPAPVMISYQ